MGRTGSARDYLIVPATFLTIILIAAVSAPAEEIHERYVCPLRQSFQPGIDTEVLSASGPFAGDFRLREVHGGGLVSLLDAARRDYNFIYFIDSSSPEALHSFKVLQALRDGGGGRIGLTAVFLDAGAMSDIRGFLAGHDLVPDFALHDPRRTQARCYGFDKTPVLHVIGPGGRIMLAASAENPVDLAVFTTDLGRLLNHECAYSRFAEARDIYHDAVNWLKKESPDMAALYLERVLEIQPQLYTVNRTLADAYSRLSEPRLAATHYGRYLASGYAYDTEEIRQTLRGLAAR